MNNLTRNFTAIYPVLGIGKASCNIISRLLIYTLLTIILLRYLFVRPLPGDVPIQSHFISQCTELLDSPVAAQWDLQDRDSLLWHGVWSSNGCLITP